ncbi:anti-sigma factor [Neorhizobium galegae]|uniref:Anti-sigma K factor RskA n=1 Tax=Neorhizobium galegae bv. orientalis str. HAMBI 540 TaxID=1028800 RepID=A0A068SWB3_NEOGA|nr:anti-sigma factor [Neorhizobium galegae]CDN50061.1 Anti-sigma K factor RskA [Neorhizobium galegae bv. orientalis str. HAMBI 540]
MTSGEQSQGRRPQDEILAGEYVLGVLSLEARHAVEQRMASDRAFARIVERWQADLASFNDDYQDVAPRPVVFGRIETRLFGPARVAAPSWDLWNSAVFWRWFALGTSAVAVAAVFYASGVIPRPQGAAPLVAELSSTNDQINLLASYDAGNGRLRIVPVAAGGREEKSLELWLVPGSGDPRSLGVFQPDRAGELIIPADLRRNMAEGATLAVSLEPFGGSRTGLPTGPVVASGAAHRP